MDRVFHLGFRAPQKLSVDQPGWLRALDGRFIVAFIGTFSKFHSPLVLARAAAKLQHDGRKDIAIVIAGAGGDIESKVKAEVAGLQNVTMPGWLDQSGIDILLSRAAIGVCPTSIDAKFFPNKTFLYFSRGLPVLSAFKGELRKLLDDDGLGSYFHYDDDEALTEQIIRLCDDTDLYRKTCGRVQAAFAERFDERVIYSAFADYIEQHVNSVAAGQWVD